MPHLPPPRPGGGYDDDGDVEYETLTVVKPLVHVDFSTYQEKEHIWLPKYCYFCVYSQTQQDAQSNKKHMDLVRVYNEAADYREPHDFVREVQTLYNETIRPCMMMPDGTVGEGPAWCAQSIWDHGEKHATTDAKLDRMALRTLDNVLYRIRDYGLFTEMVKRHPETKQVVSVTPSYDPKQLNTFIKVYGVAKGIATSIQKSNATRGGGLVS